MQTLSHEHLDILLNKNARCFQYAMEVENDEYELSLSTGTQHAPLDPSMVLLHNIA